MQYIQHNRFRTMWCEDCKQVIQAGESYNSDGRGEIRHTLCYIQYLIKHKQVM